MGMNLSSQKCQPYVTVFNNKTLCRMIAYFGDTGDDDMVDPAVVSSSGSGRTNNFTLFGSGFPASTEVARVVITAIVEFIPTQDFFQICPVDFPYPGPWTEQYESMLVAKYPIIQSLDLVDARKVANAIPAATVAPEEVTQAIEAALLGIQPRQYMPHFDDREGLAVPYGSGAGDAYSENDRNDGVPDFDIVPG
jgi:hypothetical protein